MEYTQIRNLRLYNGDNMEYMKDIPDNYYDLAVVDPPYRDSCDNQPTKDMRANGNIDKFGDKPTKQYFDELFRISKEQIIWGANNFELPPYMGFIVWKKKTIGETFTMSMAELAYLSKGLGTTSKVFEYPPQRNSTNNWHPTSKPVKLYEWIYLNYAKHGDKILDTHLGSGSSAIAAYNVNMNLTFDGIELDKEYFDSAVNRVREQTRQLSLF